MLNTLRCEHLNVVAGHKILCADLNWTVKCGEVWGILGPNGAGKTTLLQTLAGLKSATRPNIFLEQNPLSSFATRDLARVIGILFQDFHDHFPQTIWDYCVTARFPHLSYFSKLKLRDYKKILFALKQTALWEYRDMPIHHLSGGEKRRLSIAGILAQSPIFYLLDEPTNHLDVPHQLKILQSFGHLARTKGAGIIMSLHDMNLVEQFCDHVLLMFGNGNYLQGLTKNVLTNEHLSILYQYPIVSFTHNGRRIWHTKT